MTEEKEMNILTQKEGVFESEKHKVVQADLELTILLPPPPVLGIQV